MINIEIVGKSLRLRWTYNKERYSLNLGLKNSEAGVKKAKEIASKIETDIYNGIFDKSLTKYGKKSESESEITCLELFREWLDFKAKFVDSRTLDWYKITGSKLDDLRNHPANEIFYSQTMEFLLKLQEDNLSPITIKRILQNLRACWGWGIKRQLINLNPWVEITPLIKVPASEMPQPFTKAEVRLIVEGFEELYPEFVPFIKFLFGTGCRIGEARGLLWSCLDGKCVRCEINGTLSRLGRRKQTKTGKNRILILPESLQKMLLEVRLKQDAPDGYVFLFWGKPIDDYGLRHRWEKVLAKKAIAYRKPYNTRSTFISHALEQGIPPATIAQHTGHSVRVLLDFYAGSVEKRPKLPDMFE